MVHHHSHSHAQPGQGHAHHPVPKTYTRAFQIGIALNIGFVLIEAAFGWISQSLALLADAGHNLSDVLGLNCDQHPDGAVVFFRQWARSQHSRGLLHMATDTRASVGVVLLGVAKVHDLHIWAMSTTETALTAHLVMPAGSPGDGFWAEVSDDLHHHFEIDHTTLQIETGDDQYPCRLEPDHQV